jgi:hypothetical protein
MFGGLAFVVNGHMCCVVLNKDEKETVVRAKEANQRSEAESKETKHGGGL